MFFKMTGTYMYIKILTVIHTHQNLSNIDTVTFSLAYTRRQHSTHKSSIVFFTLFQKQNESTFPKHFKLNDTITYEYMKIYK